VPITILIPTHDRMTLLRRLLDSLGQADRPTSQIRTLVVENGGQFGGEQLVAEAASWLRAEYVHHPEPNKSAALNRAIESAGDDLLIFFDDDIRVSAGVLTAYERVARQFGPGCFFGGPFRVDYESPPPAWLKPYLPPSALGVDHGPEPREVGKRFIGMNWAAFATDIRQCAGFDPRFGPGSATGSSGQEVTMQIALQGRGARAIYTPDALVWHYVPRERCSPEWVLRRAYNKGIARALRRPHTRPSFLGHPIGLLPAAVQCHLRTVGYRLLGNAPARYGAEYDLALLRGMRQGNAIRSSQPDAQHRRGANPTSGNPAS
jgi:GT2 family glycosyltransferase